MSIPGWSMERFDREIASRGWVTLAAALPPPAVERLNAQLDEAYTICRAIQIKNGVGAGTDGTVHHLPCLKGAFLDLLDENVCGPYLDRFFGGAYILNNYGGVLNLPSELSYVGRVHRDLRSFSGDLNLMVQLLIMLDDFTEDNGATYLLSGSHRAADKPSDELFFANAERATGGAGSIVVFNSNLWHAAGANRTGTARRALTIGFTRPFLKQQLDYPRALGYEFGDTISDTLRQVLGYNARVPATLDEWYQPPEKRMYRPGQG